MSLISSSAMAAILQADDRQLSLILHSVEPIPTFYSIDHMKISYFFYFIYHFELSYTQMKLILFRILERAVREHFFFP